MKTISLPSGTYCLIKVSEDSIGFYVQNKDNLYSRLSCHGGSPILDSKLPDGVWEIVRKASEISEEQWEAIVDSHIYSGRISFQAYMDYSGKKPESMDDIISSAKESGHSLLSSLGFDLNTVILKLRQDGENL